MMFDMDPALIEVPYHNEIVVDGETKVIGSLKVLYDDMYAFLEQKPLAASNVNQPGVEKVNLVLYSRGSCPYCQRVLGYLRRIHKTIPVKDIGRSPQYANELLQVGGKQQVPCLVINGKPLYESKDIIKWLESHQDLY